MISSVSEWQKRLAFKYVGPFGEAKERCIKRKVVRLESNERSVVLHASGAQGLTLNRRFFRSCHDRSATAFPYNWT